MIMMMTIPELIGGYLQLIGGLSWFLLLIRNFTMLMMMMITIPELIGGYLQWPGNPQNLSSVQALSANSDSML